jgi:hypothetical protein
MTLLKLWPLPVLVSVPVVVSSEPGRSSARTCCVHAPGILSEVLPRIKNSWKTKQLNHYMLFSNRRLAGKGNASVHVCVAASSNERMASMALGPAVLMGQRSCRQ